MRFLNFFLSSLALPFGKSAQGTGSSTSLVEQTPALTNIALETPVNFSPVVPETTHNYLRGSTVTTTNSDRLFHTASTATYANDATNNAAVSLHQFVPTTSVTSHKAKPENKYLVNGKKVVKSREDLLKARQLQQTTLEPQCNAESLLNALEQNEYTSDCVASIGAASCTYSKSRFSEAQRIINSCKEVVVANSTDFTITQQKIGSNYRVTLSDNLHNKQFVLGGLKKDQADSLMVKVRIAPTLGPTYTTEEETTPDYGETTADVSTTENTVFTNSTEIPVSTEEFSTNFSETDSDLDETEDPTLVPGAEMKSSLSTTAKTLIGVGAAAGTLLVASGCYLYSRKKNPCINQAKYYPTGSKRADNLHEVKPENLRTMSTQEVVSQMKILDTIPEKEDTNSQTLTAVESNETTNHDKPLNNNNAKLHGGNVTHSPEGNKEMFGIDIDMPKFTEESKQPQTPKMSDYLRFPDEHKNEEPEMRQPPVAEEHQVQPQNITSTNIPAVQPKSPAQHLKRLSLSSSSRSSSSIEETAL